MVNGNKNDDDINHLIMKSRNTWYDPVTYLQKRGYIENSTESETTNSPILDELDEEEPANKTQSKENESSPDTPSNQEIEKAEKLSVMDKIKNFWNKIIHHHGSSSNETKDFVELRDALSQYLVIEEELRPSRNTNTIEAPLSSNLSVPTLSICTDVLKGFSHDDVEYLKKFVDCWKSNEDNENNPEIGGKSENILLSKTNESTCRSDDQITEG